jgi:nucleoside-diphosphate-sugar epimerase
MILVTGGTGFTGAHLLYHLLQKEPSVRALKRPSSSLKTCRKIFSYYTDKPDEYFSRIEWVDGDILDIYSLLPLLDGVQKVFHTAALVSFDPGDKDRIMETNVAGTANVVNACLEKKVEKLAYVSSIAALGREGNEKLVTEESEWKPSKNSSPYSQSKYEAEREVWRGMAEGLKAVIVNPSVILGPGDFSKGSLKMFQTVYQGLKFYTRGVNGYVDVNDVAKALIWLMESEISEERFILNSENVSYQKLFQMMASALGVSPPKQKAGKIISALSWRLFKIQALFTGKKPLVTRQTARTANSFFRYSNEKFIGVSGFSFTPVKTTIEKTAQIFLSEV